MQSKIITIVLVLIIIGGLAWYFNSTYIDNKTDSNQLPLPSESSDFGNWQNQKLVYATSSSVREIWQINEKKDIKKLFTDADEKDKIIQISNLANESFEVLLLTTPNKQSVTGKLVLLNVLDPNPKVLQENFAKSDIFAFSNDGQKLAYTRFSNIDENYGFTIYLENKTGQNKNSIVRSETEILDAKFSQDNKSIAYTINTNSGGELRTVNTESKEDTLIQSFPGKVIDSLSWASKSSWYLTFRDINGKSGKIIKIDNKKNQTEVTNFEGGIANFLTVSSKSDLIAFLVAQYKSKIDEVTSGQVFSFIPNLNEKSAIIKGVQILGWVK